MKVVIFSRCLDDVKADEGGKFREHNRWKEFMDNGCLTFSGNDQDKLCFLDDINYCDTYNIEADLLLTNSNVSVIYHTLSNKDSQKKMLEENGATIREEAIYTHICGTNYYDQVCSVMAADDENSVSNELKKLCDLMDIPFIHDLANEIILYLFVLTKKEDVDGKINDQLEDQLSLFTIRFEQLTKSQPPLLDNLFSEDLIDLTPKEKLKDVTETLNALLNMVYSDECMTT